MEFCNECHYEMDSLCLDCETAFCSTCDQVCPNQDMHDTNHDEAESEE